MKQNDLILFDVEALGRRFQGLTWDEHSDLCHQLERVLQTGETIVVKQFSSERILDTYTKD